MTPRQLHLLPAAKPLARRLGDALFRTVPKVPGVYIMTGQDQRVLYIGQSKNLRARLGSYKNARLDRAPRKVVRLLHEVTSIAWETCPSAEAARVRENELLRLHRPRFNRMNTFPRAYVFLWLRRLDSGFELGHTREAHLGANRYGAFKTGALLAYAALLRLVWAALNRPASWHEFPARLLRGRPPGDYSFQGEGVGVWLDPIDSFLGGASDKLLDRLGRSLPSLEQLPPFHRALQAHDLEVMAGFYRVGPRRNHVLRGAAGFAGMVLAPEELDDLLAAHASQVRTDPREGQCV